MEAMAITELLYQFLVGGAIFAFGLIIPWRAGDYSWGRREDRLTLILMLSCFFLYLVLQVMWYLYAVGTS